MIDCSHKTFFSSVQRDIINAVLYDAGGKISFLAMSIEH